MNNININLYLYEVFKSKYLESNKDKILDQDEINTNLENLKLLYLFNTDLPQGKYLDFFKEHGTLVNVSGYGYNLDKLAYILTGVTGTSISGKDLLLIDNKANGDMKELSLFNIVDQKKYKLKINKNNSVVIIPKTFSSYGVNMLCMDEVEDLEIEDEFLIDNIMNCMKNNGGYITEYNKLYLFKNIIPKTFMRKWDKENMIVSIYLNDYRCFDNDYNDFYKYIEDDDEDE